MVSLNRLQEGWLYFYEFEGDIAIGEYISEWERMDCDDEDYDPYGHIQNYLAEVWSDDSTLSHTYINQNCDTIKILKELCNAYTPYKLDVLIKDLKEEFPEYFI